MGVGEGGHNPLKNPKILCFFSYFGATMKVVRSTPVLPFSGLWA
jgi:hypothetical protein